MKWNYKKHFVITSLISLLAYLIGSFVTLDFTYVLNLVASKRMLLWGTKSVGGGEQLKAEEKM